MDIERIINYAVDDVTTSDDISLDMIFTVLDVLEHPPRRIYTTLDQGNYLFTVLCQLRLSYEDYVRNLESYMPSNAADDTLLLSDIPAKLWTQESEVMTDISNMVGKRLSGRYEFLDAYKILFPWDDIRYYIMNAVEEMSLESNGKNVIAYYRLPFTVGIVQEWIDKEKFYMYLKRNGLLSSVLSRILRS